MDEEPAARRTDEIAHGFGLLAMVAGAVAGVVIGAAVVAATAATGGAAAVIIAGAVAGGGLAAGQLVRGVTTIFNLPEPTSGIIAVGSMNVFINDLAASRASIDFAAGCSGLPLNHLPLYAPVLIAEGSKSVRTNDVPQSRLKMKMVCGAHIKSASPNVIIGGPTERTNFVWDLEGWFQTGLEWLGMAALVGGAIIAAAAGVAAFVGFAAVTGATMIGFEALGALGNMIGPGYGDLFQGVAGLGMLFAMPRMARNSRARAALNELDPVNAAARDRAAVTRSSEEHLAARRRAEAATNAAEREAHQRVADQHLADAREVLKPHVDKGDVPAIIERLDVSTQRDRGYLWSGDKEGAGRYANAHGGTTLEQTPGGRVIDNWDYLNNKLPWDAGGERLWGGVSEKYARQLSGDVRSIQTVDRNAVGGGYVFKTYERPQVEAGLADGRISSYGDIVIPNPPPKP
jgi:hypothetical protein